MQTVSFIKGKNGSAMCGDALYAGEHFIAVIDGATPKGRLMWEGMPADMFVSHFIAEQMQLLPADICAADAIKTLNAAVADYYAASGRPDLSIEEMLQASLIIYSISRREIWSFGDCQFMVNGVLGSKRKAMDEVLAAVRGLYIQAELRSGKTVEELRREDTGRAYILPLLRRQGLFMNKSGKYGYPVLCGGEFSEEQIRVIKVCKGDEIVLASDGYPRLCPTLEESERVLEDIISRDPLCIELTSETKGVVVGNVSFDDRSFVSFTAP